MGQVQVQEVSIDSHLPTEQVLKSILDGEPVEITFVADGGNGARVNLTLQPDQIPSAGLRDVFKSDEVHERFRALGFSLENNREFYERQDELHD